VSVVAIAACSSDSGSTDELCQALGENPGFASVFEGFDPTDATAALEQLRTARVELGELKDVAPDEVGDDLQVEIDYVQGLIDALEALEPDADASEVALTVQSVTDVHPDVRDAAATLEQFAKDEC
jgi:hypothetical protein